MIGPLPVRVSQGAGLGTRTWGCRKNCTRTRACNERNFNMKPECRHSQGTCRTPGSPAYDACLGCKRSRVQISAARPKFLKDLQTVDAPQVCLWSPTGVHTRALVFTHRLSNPPEISPPTKTGPQPERLPHNCRSNTAVSKNYVALGLSASAKAAPRATDRLNGIVHAIRVISLLRSCSWSHPERLNNDDNPFDSAFLAAPVCRAPPHHIRS
jgi:hypothetical protein